MSTSLICNRLISHCFVIENVALHPVITVYRDLQGYFVYLIMIFIFMMQWLVSLATDAWALLQILTGTFTVQLTQLFILCWWKKMAIMKLTSHSGSVSQSKEYYPPQGQGPMR